MNTEHKPTDSRLIIGIILIVLGGLLMLNSLGLVDWSLSYYIFSWKTLLIFIGIILITNKQRKIAGTVLIVLGLAFWFPIVFGINVRFHQVFWPLLLIGLGVVVITRRGNIPGKNNWNKEHWKKNFGGATSYTDDFINDVSIFGGGHKRVETKNFKGGNLTSVFGGSEINLLNAEMANEGCILDVFTLFGGTTLIVPANWKVQIDAVSILGGLNDKRRVAASELDQSKVLVIKGVVMLGGIEIKSF
jgi:predicted membrane protein